MLSLNPPVVKGFTEPKAAPSYIPAPPNAPKPLPPAAAEFVINKGIVLVAAFAATALVIPAVAASLPNAPAKVPVPSPPTPVPTANPVIPLPPIALSAT